MMEAHCTPNHSASLRRSSEVPSSVFGDLALTMYQYTALQGYQRPLVQGQKLQTLLRPAVLLVAAGEQAEKRLPSSRPLRADPQYVSSG
jgi:hypothetical protein